MLEKIIAKGNRGHHGYSENSLITCKDGFHMSVIAGGGTYCRPRPTFCACYFDHLSEKFITSPGSRDAEHDYPGPYTHVEVGFPSLKPEPWEQWAIYSEDNGNWEETVFGAVPVFMVRALVALHGGETDDNEHRDASDENDRQRAATDS